MFIPQCGKAFIAFGCLEQQVKASRIEVELRGAPLPTFSDYLKGENHMTLCLVEVL